MTTQPDIPLTPLYGYIASNGAFLSVTPNPDERPLVEIVADDSRGTAAVLNFASITAAKFAEDLDRAIEAACAGDTTVHGSEPRIDTAGDSIQVTPGPDDGGLPRVTIAAEEHRADPDGHANVAVEVPVSDAVDLAAAIRTASRHADGEDTTPPATAPHITRTVGYGGTADADCRLCGAHASCTGLWAAQDADAWTQAHARWCTPETVRVKATHLRDAAELLWEYAEADPSDGTDWDDPVVTAAVDRLRAHLQQAAQRLEAAAHTAELATATTTEETAR